ncbi:MAG: VIT family protein [Thiotrichales bacterium]|jgi:VIT1/CCC1 family predicted Fe2+/Mn2+ transporter|nr:VIT family protein [Thiotrichales bacterium]
MLPQEHHLVHRTGWLRAAVLGANDGLISTASLLVGVAAAGATQSSILVAGVAGLVAGAMSMAAGEYVSVSSQADTEKADIAREAHELAHNSEEELKELALIYEARGLTPELAMQVAQQLTEHDALAAHVRDEIGITETLTAKPLEAALTSAITFTVGAALPLFVAWFAPASLLTTWIVGTTLLFLALLGGIGAQAGGAPVLVGAARVTFWGVVALSATMLVGALFGRVLV